jgi:Rrf2 family protein
MLFSPPTRHALRALVYIARHRGSAPILAREIAGAGSIPRAFLSKILRRLCAAGVLQSTMGPGGGYALARPAGDIRVGDVIRIFDDLNTLSTQCILRRGACDEQTSCVLHQSWKRFLEEFAEGIAGVTLEEIAAPVPGAERKPADGSRGRAARDGKRQRAARDASRARPVRRTQPPERGRRRHVA